MLSPAFRVASTSANFHPPFPLATGTISDQVSSSFHPALRTTGQNWHRLRKNFGNKILPVFILCIESWISMNVPLPTISPCQARSIELVWLSVHSHKSNSISAYFLHSIPLSVRARQSDPPPVHISRKRVKAAFSSSSLSFSPSQQLSQQ